jgi:hypothetical protein
MKIATITLLLASYNHEVAAVFNSNTPKYRALSVCNREKGTSVIAYYTPNKVKKYITKCTALLFKMFNTLEENTDFLCHNYNSKILIGTLRLAPEDLQASDNWV